MTWVTRHKRFTDAELAAHVQAVTTMPQLLQRLGLRYAGGTHSLYRNRIKRLELDVSHWKGGGKSGWTGGSNKKVADMILVNEPDAVLRGKAYQLRRAMIEVGIPYVCGECGQGPVWNEKPLTLQIEHKNGNSRDNRRENLCFLCPNCHTQTETYAIAFANRKQGG